MEETTPPSTSSQNNRRIAKNTLMLYFRMILTMLVSLYTSRVVLNKLGVEDFGIAPIEAQSCGTPVIAYRAGGIKETVIENITGVFFNEQTTNSLNEAIQRFEDIEWDYQRIHQHAQTFSEDRFCKEITAYVSSCEQEFFKNNI